ncbi:MAG TPA: hypothetical protein V6C52_11570 [Coleofasciculaceae cyanobacterium]|jgi:hypothetical protein
MIDTIRLILDEGTFHINEPDRFQPNAKTILDLKERFYGGRLMKAVLNPTKQEKQDTGYAPRLTLRRRPPNIIELVIEFSIPKLLYGNNFDEISETDFSKVIEVLQDKLEAWGILIFAELLRKAPVGSIHYGKNIVLPRYTLCKSIINLLSKAPIKQWMDHNKVDFRNGGHLYKVHTDNFELAFYDKVKDLQQAKRGAKRAYEPEANVQGDLFDYFEVATDVQVLRMEARLNSRSQIQRMLKAVGLPDDDLRFFALFSKDIAQKTLLHHWKPYKSAMALVAMSQSGTPSAMMDYLVRQDQDAAINTHLQRLGAMMLIGEVGWPGLRSLWDGMPRSFQRLKKDLESLPVGDKTRLSDIEAIDATLRAFEPVKMEQLNNANAKAVTC